METKEVKHNKNKANFVKCLHALMLAPSSWYKTLKNDLWLVSVKPFSGKSPCLLVELSTQTKYMLQPSGNS